MNTSAFFRSASCVLLLCLAPSCVIAADRVIIDGVKNPEKIPDETAWLMLFRSVADGPGAPGRDVRAVFLSSAGFSSVDANIVINAANEAMARIRSMESPILNAYPTASSKTEALRAQRDSILRDVVAILLQRLSPEAADKFRTHINSRVKRGVRITQ
ncbi:hypothetical protein [Paludibaculum fermentans]|uniref:hypothetical protein n=1 Tax=Paludibaculum fermentans TaxID=1473598 RepID=UPI003EB936F1